MRQVIKTLKWIILLLWTITLVLPVTVAIFVSRLLETNTIAFREPETALTNGTVLLSGPFFINNTGFYDLTNINITILLKTASNATLASNTKLLATASAGSTVTSVYELAFSLDDNALRNEGFLTQNTNLNLDVSSSFTVVSVITLGIGSSFATQWKAPFLNLTVGYPKYDDLTQQFSFSLSFMNSANFILNGSLSVSVIDDLSNIIGLVQTDANVSPETLFQRSFDFNMSRLVVTTSGSVLVYFNGVYITKIGWNLHG